MDDLRKWFRKKEVGDYINWCRYFPYIFPDLHMNDQTRSYGSSLYTFNAVDFPKEKNWEKTLHHFYNLCNIIFKEIRDNLSEPVIHLFHDKRLGNGIATAVKLCNEIHPSESANYCCIMKEAFKKLFEDDFTNRFFLKENLYGEFLSLLASGHLIEVTGMIMAVLFVTLWFNKNMATKEVLYQISDY